MLNKEYVLNSLENLIKKNCDFQNLITNITIVHNLMKKFAKRISNSLLEMNYQETYHTKIAVMNIGTIDNVHKIKNILLTNNSNLKKHIKICNIFLEKKQEEINYIKYILNIKKKGSNKNWLSLFENLFKLNELKSINFSESENYLNLNNIYDDIENIGSEMSDYSSIIINFYNDYLLINFNLKTNLNFEFLFNTTKNKEKNIIISFKKEEENSNNLEFNSQNKIIFNKFNNKTIKNKNFLKIEKNDSEYSFKCNKSNNPLKISFKKNNYSIEPSKKINGINNNNFKEPNLNITKNNGIYKNNELESKTIIKSK